MKYETKRVSLASNESPTVILRPKLKQGWEIIYSTTSYCFMRRPKK